SLNLIEKTFTRKGSPDMRLDDRFCGLQVLYVYTISGVGSIMENSPMDDMPLLLPAQPVRFMNHLRTFIHARGLSYTTEQTYCTWIKDFIRFHRLAKPVSLSAVAVDTFRNALKAPMGAAKISTRCVVLLDKGLRRTPKA